jgi:predicted P-loop ATPase
VPGPRSRLDFDAIAQAALARAELLVAAWLPGGKRDGHEWKCGSLSGEAGDSCSVNLNSGLWADFATDERGGDLISLYAAVRGIRQGEAARELAVELGLQVDVQADKSRAGSSERPQRAGDQSARGGQAERRGKAPEVAAQPAAQPTPSDDAWRDAGAWPADGPAAPLSNGWRPAPEASWTYRDAQGGVLGYVRRYRTSTGGKEVLPCVWSTHPTKGTQWKWRAFSDPRPLYRLDLLAERPEAPVLVVEGEKCVDAAQAVLGDKVVVTTWPSGSKAVNKADWSPLKGRRVVVWPDADAKTDKAGQLLPLAKQPGMAAAEAVAKQLVALDCDVRLVQLPEPGALPDGYDVADVIEATPDDGSDGTPADRVRHWLRPENLRQAVPLPAAGGASPPPPDGAPQGGGDGRDNWRDRLRWGRNGYEASLANVTLIMRSDDRWRGVLGFDEFSQRTLKRLVPPYAFGRAGEWDSEDDSRTAIWLSDNFQMTVRADLVAEAVETVAREFRFHPVREYLRGLTWDGERRLEEWLIQFAGVADCQYSRAVSSYFLRGMVRRVMEPGCKFDYALVLEGEEGLRKSTLCATLGGPWYSDTDLDLTHKDSMSALRGKWLHEFSEMDSVTRAEASKQKSFLSRSVDEFRPVYGRREIRCPRQVVFVGTTNEDEYIKEGQGARRFWPVRITRPIDIESLRKVLPQLMAEAVADYDAGEPYYPLPEEQRELFQPEQKRRVVQESLIDALHDWVLEPDMEELNVRAANGGLFSIADAAYRCLKVAYAQLTRDLQTRIGKALGALGCTKVERRNGMTRYWYKPPQKVATSVVARQPAQHSQEGDDDPLPF